MKEFDIYLNKRLTECDIIVYSIPYRDGLTAINRLILESCVESYTLAKFIAVQTGSELVSHIDEMLKICHERLYQGISIGASAGFDTHYAIQPKKSGIVISTGDVKMLAASFIEANNALQITAEPLDARLAKPLGTGHSDINLKAAITDTLKRSVERFSPSVQLNAVVNGTNKQGFIHTESGVAIETEVSNLCYQVYSMVETALQIAASVLDTEIHYSLGSGMSGFVLSASIGDGGSAEKFIAIQSAVSILSAVTESLRQFFMPEDISISIGMEVACIVKRHRLLNEMDEDELLLYDDMTFEDVDYVIIL